MKMKHRVTNRLIKKCQKGFRGFPVVTVAYYGPDDRKATKVAVGLIRYEGVEAEILERFYSDEKDLRFDEDITNRILELIKEHDALSVSAFGKIIGCPHEEGKDYPLGEVCPQCPFWAEKDRWEGVLDE